MGGDGAERIVRTLNLEQYAKETGGKTDADVQGHIHAGLRSVKQTKTYRRFFDTKLRDLQRQADVTRDAYRAAIAAGEIVAPAKPSLEETAKGEGEAAAAARRLIEKRVARAALKGSVST